MNHKTESERDEPNEEEGIERLNDKIREMKQKKITPPVDDDEPAGLLSGGPEHLDIDDET